jgi:hypothetical protein
MSLLFHHVNMFMLRNIKEKKEKPKNKKEDDIELKIIKEVHQSI